MDDTHGPGRRRRRPGVFLTLSFALFVGAAPGIAESAADVSYGEHIRPILSDRCFTCHGPDAAQRQAGLRLDDPANATAQRDGYAVIVPGDPEASVLWERITSSHAAEIMPPPESGRRPLTADEVDLVRRWITDGAEYEAHWSHLPPERPETPSVTDAVWCRTDIDRFILARLEAAGLTPSRDADEATFIRRLFLDVTGLPPTPAEVDAFIGDERPDAVEQWVDRLLNTEPYRSRYAEHWTSSWLDAARYGDTSGIHMDNGRQIWLWRDWVLNALRENMPFDQFLIEQLAGDLLPDATTSQKIASGFNRNHVTTDEGGAIPEEYLVEYAIDRVDTTATVFLGLTMGCARCHDHKYDPVTQEEFYRFLSFFNSIDEPGLYTQTDDAKRAYEPFLEVPSPAQATELGELRERVTSLTEMLEQVPPDEADERETFVQACAARSGVRWTTPEILSATSSDAKITLTPQPDRSIQAAGPMPANEDYVVHLRTSEDELRLILLEALATPDAGPGAGRASHGNAVISALTVEARPEGADEDWRPVPMRWAWSDHAQTDRDFDPTNLIRPDDETLGWSVDGNEKAGRRLLGLLTDAPFGFERGTELRVTMAFRSMFTFHSLGRIRVRVGSLPETAIARLPVALGRWYLAGPFPEPRATAFDTVHGPETTRSLAPDQTFGPDKVPFRFDAALADERVVPLAGDAGSNYVGRLVFSPDERELPISLGSDDGFRLFVNGVEVAQESVDRGAAPDQAEALVPLRAGRNLVVLKIVNTGGPSGYYFRTAPGEDVLSPGLVPALVPEDAMGEEQRERFAVAWRRQVSPAYRETEREIAEAKTALADLTAAIPRTMVMKALDDPRETFVLMRGQYDHPDRMRPVTPGVPAVFGTLPGGAVPNRRDLAEWMTSRENPLVARVAVNRIWQNIFGAGLVRSSEDFGLQGEWPSHPALLDWLAVELRDHDWDVQQMIRAILTSRVYRQDSRIRPGPASIDPDNRLLARYPSRRLTAEQIRDQALFASGLLVESFGGPSVKPYQPPGLWQEVAMPNSNTRVFERGGVDDLWRRSLYTFWKRAAPPPSLQTFDAPTREACVTRRQSTNTPLQALVLWNDEQFVEAARVLAQRTLTGGSSDDDARLVLLFRRSTGRTPDADDLGQLRTALEHFRERYQRAPAEAAQLLEIGEATRATDIADDELAAWTVVASSLLSLHETITQD